ncbi:MAG: hypothetical protein KME29_17385 [Calothrix sp. FI2-JRJ7]|jgi:hypothetical protein|nr:hypothetical protein [Calothrix sp. FI2-JRJ7]
MSKFQFSFLVGLISALSACVNLPAAALPGQDAQTVILWSHDHQLITGLMPSIKLQTAEPDFDSTSKCLGNELSFAVWSPNGLVSQELVDYRSSDTSFNFDPKNSAGINLIQQVYNSVIAQDFASSTLIYQRNDNTLRPSFYRGRHYGYITQHFRDRHREDRTQQRTVSQLTVVPLKQLENKIQLDKKTIPVKAY